MIMSPIEPTNLLSLIYFRNTHIVLISFYRTLYETIKKITSAIKKPYKESRAFNIT